MSAKYQAYPEYKDSGVEWLGEIPHEWNYTSLKFLSQKISTGGTPKKQSSFTETRQLCWFSPSDFINDTTLLNSSKYVTHQACLSGDAKLFPPNSIVVIGIGATLGKVAYCPKTFSCNQQINIIEPNAYISSVFLTYALSTQTEQMKQLSNASTIGIMNQEKTGNILITYPLYQEQITIANFLDHETAKIDLLIEKQERLIELLQEKRQAVISHAVTKGLNPDAPMKDSGVEWLGEVPAHWEVAALKHHASIQGGYAFNSSLFTENGIQLLRIGNVYQNKLALERQPIFISEKIADTFSDFQVTRNDILMSLTGTLGKRDYGFAVKVEADEMFLLNQRVAKITPVSNKINNDFLLNTLWSESYLVQLYALPSGTKQANLSNSDVLNITVAVPPSIKEQDTINAFIKSRNYKFDHLIMYAKRSKALLKERRTALISAAVTGKIDLRNWQAPTPKTSEDN